MQASQSLLLSARVTLEVELENSERTFGPAPREVTKGVSRVFRQVARHMRTRALAQGKRPPRSAMLGLVWPVAPVIITSWFGHRRDPLEGGEEIRFHSGLDLGGDRGTLVSAAGPGRVTSSGWRGGHGLSVTVQHVGGLATVYSHLGTAFAKEGDELDEGSPIGLMGSSGRSTGPHLHFEVHRQGQAIDPMEVVGRPMVSVFAESWSHE